MTQNYFQLWHRGLLLEQAVQRSGAAQLWRHRPVTGWISQSQVSNLGLSVAWTLEGIKRLSQSGLLGWQLSALKDEVTVRILEAEDPVFKDAHQVLLPVKEPKTRETQSFDGFALHKLGAALQHYVVPYAFHNEPQADGSGCICLVKQRPPCYESLPCFPLGATERPEFVLGKALRMQLGLEPSSLRKLGVHYDYDFATKEFLAFHIFLCPIAALGPKRMGPEPQGYGWSPLKSWPSKFPISAQDLSF